MCARGQTVSGDPPEHARHESTSTSIEAGPGGRGLTRKAAPCASSQPRAAFGKSLVRAVASASLSSRPLSPTRHRHTTPDTMLQSTARRTVLSAPRLAGRRSLQTVRSCGPIAPLHPVISTSLTLLAPLCAMSPGSARHVDVQADAPWQPQADGVDGEEAGGARGGRFGSVAGAGASASSSFPSAFGLLSVRGSTRCDPGGLLAEEGLNGSS